jgi:hypothetical protein
MQAGYLQAGEFYVPGNFAERRGGRIDSPGGLKVIGSFSCCQNPYSQAILTTLGQEFVNSPGLYLPTPGISPLQNGHLAMSFEGGYVLPGRRNATFSSVFSIPDGVDQFVMRIAPYAPGVIPPDPPVPTPEPTALVAAAVLGILVTTASKRVRRTKAQTTH